MDVMTRAFVGLPLMLIGAGIICIGPSLATAQQIPPPVSGPNVHDRDTVHAQDTVNVPVPRPRPHPGDSGSAYVQVNVAQSGILKASGATFKPLPRPASGPFALTSSNVISRPTLQRSSESLRMRVMAEGPLPMPSKKPLQTR
jgi:hypothetical protein